MGGIEYCIADYTDTKSYIIRDDLHMKCKHINTDWGTSSTAMIYNKYNEWNILDNISSDICIKPEKLVYQQEDSSLAYFANTAVNYNLTGFYDKGWEAPFIAPGDRMRQMIRDRMAPAIHRSRTSMSIAIDIREERARQTLRRVIGDQAYRKFMRDGFITVVPKSGLTYRIYPGCGITEVYDRGIMVDRLCVVLQGNFPPTDSLLMRYLLILNDEGEFSKYAVKHHVSQRSTQLVFPVQEVQPLTEMWAKIKVA